MTSVRAANLLDLVYKRGQAGITKASVTIVFDNSDRSTSPVGFENLRQITVTRQVSLLLTLETCCSTLMDIEFGFLDCCRRGDQIPVERP